jgi:rod shape determining protein RodA
MKNILKKDNLKLFIPLIIIMIFSFFCMYQAKFIKDLYISHLEKQIIWYIIGFIIIYLMQKVKIQFLYNNSFYFYIITNILLILVLIFGKTTNGAKAWLGFDAIKFQPSEFGKITLLLYLSKISNDFNNNKGDELRFIISLLVVTLIPSILVFLEPDTGAIIIYLIILLGILLFSNIKKRWFIIFFMNIAIIIAIFTYLYIFKEDLLIKLIGTSFFYRIDRLINFKNGSGLQLNNALTTIGNAGLLGSGIQSELLYVPEYPTDFVFTLNIAIFGLLGAAILLISYFILDLFFINKLFNTYNNQYKLFINGFIFMFLFQQIQNILMNIGMLPIMGIPLPFLSYGGSNMIVYFILIGIILNITKT